MELQYQEPQIHFKIIWVVMFRPYILPELIQPSNTWVYDGRGAVQLFLAFPGSLMVLIEDLDIKHGRGEAEHNAYNSQGQRKLPVIILTGYLGAGKTTLLNYILREQRDRRLAVIENEVGEVSVDDALLGDKVRDVDQDEVVVLDNGCVCCNIRADLVRALVAVSQRQQGGTALDGVVIELTGVADPAPVVQCFFMVEAVSEAFYVDNVVALVDCKHALMQLSESQTDPANKGTAAAQVAFSSMVLLNKTDLVSEAQVQEVERRIREINSSSLILRCQQSRVPLSQLFNVAIFSLGRVLEEQYMDEAGAGLNTFFKSHGPLNPFRYHN